MQEDKNQEDMLQVVGTVHGDIVLVVLVLVEVGMFQGPLQGDKVREFQLDAFQVDIFLFHRDVYVPKNTTKQNKL